MVLEAGLRRFEGASELADLKASVLQDIDQSTENIKYYATLPG